jgi:hypothetical protein
MWTSGKEGVIVSTINLGLNFKHVTVYNIFAVD